MTRRRTPLGTQPPELEGPEPLAIAEWRSADESVVDEPSSRAALMERGARRSLANAELLPIDNDARRGIDVEAVIEMEADEPSGPIEPPLPFEPQDFEVPPINRVAAIAPAITAASIGDALAQFAAGTQTDAPALSRSQPQFATGTQDEAPALLPDDGSDFVFVTAHGAAHGSSGAAGTLPAAPAFPRARTGGGRVAATEPAKVASGTIEPTDLVPKVDADDVVPARIDADEEHAVIVTIDDEWLERLDLPAE